MKNEMKVIFGSDSQNEQFARLVLTALVMRLDPTLEELADMENVIISLTDDEFISNENYMLFDNSFVILLEVGYKNNIKENIQKLIKKHCNYSVDVKKIKINSLVKVIN